MSASLKPYALTSLSDVKESLGLPSSTTKYDNLIIRKINQATAVIENYCGRRFKATDYENEIYNGSGIDQIVLKQRPLIVSEDHALTLKARDTALNEDDFTEVDSELIFADNESGVLDLNFRSAGHWGSYAVTYRAGYEDIPDDLAEACASLAAYYVGNADATTVNVKSKQEGQRKLDYSQNGISGVAQLFENLGIDETINSYANTAVFADK